jgi:hypothetical protein
VDVADPNVSVGVAGKHGLDQMGRVADGQGDVRELMLTELVDDDLEDRPLADGIWGFGSTDVHGARRVPRLPASTIAWRVAALPVTSRAATRLPSASASSPMRFPCS